MILGSLANVRIEDAARAAQTPLWFQLYAEPDRGVTRELIQRAEAAGFKALVVTVDTPITGVRNREQRLQFRLPPGVELVNLPGGKHRPQRPRGPEETLLDAAHLDAALTWKDIAWMQGVTSLPVLLKGVMTPADAMRAIDQGIAGVIVSNHGGRNLDTLPATIDALPRIADAVADRAPLLLDGGIRRGTDVLKALALGAKAVLVGRPFVFGLAVAGPAGVERVMHILRSELEAAMILTGRATLADIDRSVIWQS
jgi:4-hydroxymandelate oxidase